MTQAWHDNTVVVIRSVGERTERACAEAILAQNVRPEAVVTINQTPFSRALSRSYQFGIEAARKWTICVDADVILRPESIHALVTSAERLPNSALGLQGLMLDKFTCAIRAGGVHLYRTKLLRSAISMIPDEGESVRPETSVLKSLAKLGHRWSTVPYVVGVHDFGQFHFDIFRKCYVHANKHLLQLPRILPSWRRLALVDADFVTAIEGVAWGLREREPVLIDKHAMAVRDGWSRLRITEKEPVASGEFSPEVVEQTLAEWAPTEVRVLGVSRSRQRIVARRAEGSPVTTNRMVQWFEGEREAAGVFNALVSTIGAGMELTGKQLRQWSRQDRGAGK